MGTRSPHFRAKVIARAARGGSGKARRSGGGASAYRSGERIELEPTPGGPRFVFDYTRRRGVVCSRILATRHARRWARDRERLWNRVERAERRRDAQLARELELSLPAELTHLQRADLLWRFCEDHLVSRGMIADAAIHMPGDGLNHHAHVLLTMRRLTPDGEGFGLKAREWNDRALLEELKAAWEAASNAALAAARVPLRLDRRSIAVRRAEALERAATAADPWERRQAEVDAAGLDYAPLPRIGRSAWRAMEAGRHDDLRYAGRIRGWLDASARRDAARARAQAMQDQLDADRAAAGRSHRQEAPGASDPARVHPYDDEARARRLEDVTGEWLRRAAAEADGAFGHAVDAVLLAPEVASPPGPKRRPPHWPPHWPLATTLLALHPDEAPLRAVLHERLGLDPADRTDPAAWGPAWAALGTEEAGALARDVERLDDAAERADPARHGRVHAVAEAVRLYRQMRTGEARLGPLELLDGLVRPLLRRAGLKGFVDGVLVPLIRRVARTVLERAKTLAPRRATARSAASVTPTPTPTPATAPSASPTPHVLAGRAQAVLSPRRVPYPAWEDAEPPRLPAPRPGSPGAALADGTGVLPPLLPPSPRAPLPAGVHPQHLDAAARRLAGQGRHVPDAWRAKLLAIALCARPKALAAHAARTPDDLPACAVTADLATLRQLTMRALHDYGLTLTLTSVREPMALQAALMGLPDPAWGVLCRRLGDGPAGPALSRAARLLHPTRRGAGWDAVKARLCTHPAAVADALATAVGTLAEVIAKHEPSLGATRRHEVAVARTPASAAQVPRGPWGAPGP